MSRSVAVILALAGLLAGASASAQDGTAPRKRREPPRIEPVAALKMHLNGVVFDDPLGVFFDPEVDELYVADTGNDLVAIFDTSGMPKFTFGSEAGIFEPRRVMADARGRIYVADRAANVKVFSYRGEPLGPFPFHDDEGALEVQPTAMTTSAGGRLYFADQGGSRILVYDADWGFVTAFGHAGKGRGSFSHPFGLAIGPGGEIHVSDRTGVPVQVFSPEGRLLRDWGKHDLGHQNFSAPAGIAVDGAGRVFVADTLRQDVKVFDAEGNFLANFGGFGAGPGQLAYPMDVAVSPDGLIYVCEKVGRRVQVFRIAGADAGS